MSTISPTSNSTNETTASSVEAPAPPSSAVGKMKLKMDGCPQLINVNITSSSPPDREDSGGESGGEISNHNNEEEEEFTRLPWEALFARMIDMDLVLFVFC